MRRKTRRGEELVRFERDFDVFTGRYERGDHWRWTGEESVGETLRRNEDDVYRDVDWRRFSDGVRRFRRVCDAIGIGNVRICGHGSYGEWRAGGGGCRGWIVGHHDQLRRERRGVVSVRGLRQSRRVDEKFTDG